MCSTNPTSIILCVCVSLPLCLLHLVYCMHVLISSHSNEYFASSFFLLTARVSVHFWVINFLFFLSLHMRFIHHAIRIQSKTNQRHVFYIYDLFNEFRFTFHLSFKCHSIVDTTLPFAIKLLNWLLKMLSTIFYESNHKLNDTVPMYIVSFHDYGTVNFLSSIKCLSESSMFFPSYIQIF